MNIRQWIDQFEYKELFLVGFYLSFILLNITAGVIDAIVGNYFATVVEILFAFVGALFFRYYLKTMNQIFAARVIVWIGNILAFIFIYHSDFNITIVFTLLLPIGAFVLMTPREALINMTLYYLALLGLMIYGYQHLENHPLLHDPHALVTYFISLLFTVAFGIFYNFAIEESHRRLKGANAELKRANAEKEILLREVHHRVKNNLNVISSIVDLQARGMDPESARHLQLTQGRIESIAIVHEMLYRKQKDLAHIDFADYMKKLAQMVQRLHVTRDVICHIDGGGITLSADIILDLGLITNELLTNSHKHAFAATPLPRINITLEAVDAQHYRYTYRDNGSGFRDLQGTLEGKSLGLRLIRLSVKKMEGEIEFSSDTGFQTTITFEHLPE